jgi:CarD family transcriptional regulator
MAQTARSTRSSSRYDRAPAKAVKAKPVAKTKPASKGRTKSSAPVLKTAQAVAPKASRTTAEPAKATKAEPPKVEAAKVEPPKAPPIVQRGYVPLVNIPPLPPAPKNLNLSVGDKAVHPAHGLGEITAIEHREIGGAKGEFFILRILDNGMRVMVPRTSAQAAGLRPVMSTKEADKVLETMRAREVAVDLQPWSRRFRAYTEMIKSGSPHEVAKVLRDMYRLKFDKELSFGERRLLDQAKSLLMKELAAAKGVTEAVLQARVDDMFRA